ncbi:MAG: hypothetical protein GWN71_02080, partial [Gammaproteobacteria bacterium]|nr:hypothetical protein [Gemmatimonadota bacterium]NIU72401.1 hypothetical protein [Gammaproteobacteria bacterium]
CHHFLAGFFTPAPADTTLEPMTLDSGGSIEEQTSIRFAASALALRALFAWGADSTDLRLHLAGLRRLSE